MHNGKRMMQRMGAASKSLKGMRRAAMAGVAGAVVALGNIGGMIKDRAEDLHGRLPIRKETNSEGVVEMRKSTLVALFVALAAVAGVLGALYMYVLRREKELDEYEQLLFSEDFANEPADGDWDEDTDGEVAPEV